MRNRIVFMDCGLTLVEVRMLREGEDAPEGFIKVAPMWAGDHGTAVRARPSAREALERLRDAGECVAVLSGGMAQEQSTYLQVVGLRNLVQAVYGSDNCRGLRAPESWVLVDDDSEPRSKIATLLGYRSDNLPDDVFRRALDEHLVRCTAFYDGDDRQPLTAVLDEVTRKLGPATAGSVGATAD